MRLWFNGYLLRVCLDSTRLKRKQRIRTKACWSGTCFNSLSQLSSVFANILKFWRLSVQVYRTSIISTRYEVDMTIHFRVIAFCLLIRHVTLWPWPLNFSPLTVAVHGGSRDQHCHYVWRLYAYPITFPIGYAFSMVISDRPCSATVQGQKFKG